MLLASSRKTVAHGYLGPLFDEIVIPENVMSVALENELQLTQGVGYTYL